MPVGVQSRDPSVRGLAPAPVFPPGTFLAISFFSPRNLSARRSTACAAFAPVWRPERASAPAAALRLLPTRSRSSTNWRTARSSRRNRRPSNSGGDDNRRTVQARRASTATTANEGAWEGSSLPGKVRPRKGSHATVLEDRRSAGRTTTGRRGVGFTVRPASISARRDPAAHRANGGRNSPFRVCAMLPQEQQRPHGRDAIL